MPSTFLYLMTATHTALATDTLLSGALERTLVLEVVYTVVNGLTEGSTLGYWLLAVTAADTNTVDDEALLCLVAQTTSLVGARGARDAVHDGQLTELPAAHAQQEPHQVRLLLGVDRLHVLVSTHVV